MAISYMSEKQRQILDDLRAEICLGDPSKPMIMRESEIAERYGVSRTPIRQVIQYLSHTLMVETKRGYGTVVTPLVPENRTREMEAYIAMSKACAMYLKGASIPKEVVVELAGLNTWLSLLDERSESEFLELNSRIVSVISATITDDLLRHAYISLHWRLIRWRVVDIRDNQDMNWEKVEHGLKEAIETAMKRDASALMIFASQMGERHLHPEAGYFDAGVSTTNIHALETKK